VTNHFEVKEISTMNEAKEIAEWYNEADAMAKKLHQLLCERAIYSSVMECENKQLRAALRQARCIALASGVTMREYAKNLGITAAQLSAWTDQIPDREPDFKD